VGDPGKTTPLNRHSSW